MAEINLPDDAIKKLISEAYGKVWSVKKRVDNYNNGRKFVPEYTNAPRTFGVKTAGEKMKQILLLLQTCTRLELLPELSKR